MRKAAPLEVLSLAMMALGLLCPTVNAQNNEWSWMGGSNQGNQTGVYGALQTPSANNYPGSRSGPVTWTDSEGNFWLFGGYGYDASGNLGELNDMWEFTPSTKQWVWVSGSSTLGTNYGGQSGEYGTLGTASAANVPGGRGGAIGWTDSKGNLWLFGGDGFDSSGSSGYLNDLWTFNPSSNEWTWMGGSSSLPTCPSTNSCGPSGVYGTLGTPSSANIPGGRASPAGWTDSNGNFWLFGGEISFTYLNGWGTFLNDLWEFNPTTHEWAWMGGSNSPPTCSATCGQPGIYGTLESPASGNVPGARTGAVTWADTEGDLWLFGGEGLDSTDTFGELNDVWKFNPSTNDWAWMSGSSTVGNKYSGPSGIYGTWMTPGPGNTPGGRDGSVSWKDEKGNFWLFGGDGYDSSGVWALLNDLWEFSPSTNEWAWMGGSQSGGQNGTYGTLGTPSIGNSPGSRSTAVGWTDDSGNFWLLGGQGYGSAGAGGSLNDLWEYQPYQEGLTVAATPTFTPGPGTYTSSQTVTLYDTTPGAVIYYMVNSNAPPVQYTSPITVTSSASITAVATATGYANSDAVTAAYTLDLPPPAAPTFDPPAGTYYSPQTVSISDAMSYASIYYTTDGTTPNSTSAQYAGPIYVSSSETLTAIAVVSGNASSLTAVAAFNILPTPLNTWAWIGGTNSLDQSGTYGQLGLPLSQNMPGSRVASVSWTDTSGNFWLFGGKGTDSAGDNGWLNDLWKYNPSDTSPQDDQWTWMGGSNINGACVAAPSDCGKPGIYGALGTPATSNIPGGRQGAVSWTDGSGNLWLFGGYGYDSTGRQIGLLNDLWRFNPSSNQWVWVSGSSTQTYIASNEGYGEPGVYGTLGIPAAGNTPGGREFASAWTDANGNLWLFGGQGDDAGGQDGHLNDIWKFDPSTNRWTWMGGTELLSGCVDVVGNCGQPGVYGTLGMPAAGNIPGGRSQAATWTDNGGNFWLFGGSGYDSNDQLNALNDLWKFNPTTNQWAWIGGTSALSCPFNPSIGFNVCVSQPSIFGTMGVAAAGNVPGGSTGASTWIDASGNMWLFGANGLNNLWAYNPSLNEWTWMGGDSASSNCIYFIIAPIPVASCSNSQGVFGSQYTPSIGTIPEARTNAVSWADKNGMFWLFSGGVSNLSDLGGWVNDLWEYQPSLTTLPPATTPIFSLTPGTYASEGPLTIVNGMANATIYYTTDGTTPTTSSTLYSGTITISSSETIKAIATAPGYINSGVASATYVVAPVIATPTFSVTAGTYSAVQTVTISDATASVTIYYTTDGTAPTPNSNVYSGSVTVSSSETIHATAVLNCFTIFNGLASLGGAVASNVASAAYTIDLSPTATPTFSVPAGTYSSAQEVTISDTTPGASIYYTTNGTTPTTNSIVYSTPITVSASEMLEAIAVASGDSNSAVATASYTINLPSPVFTLAASPTSLTVQTGAQGTVNLIVTPQNGFNSAVTFACSGQPSDVSCNFNPASVIPNGNTATTSALTVTVAPQSSSVLPDHSPFLPTTTLALAGCALFWRRRRKIYPWLSGTILLLSIGVFSSCGGAGGGGGGGTNPPPTTATITITASSGTLQQTARIVLTLN